MKITWSKLSPEERDRAVCEAVGIPPKRVRWAYPGCKNHWRSEQKAIEEEGRFFYKLKPEECRIFPKVSTDANEALRVLAALDGHATLNTPLRENDVRQWHCTINICQAEMPDFCRAICIACLRAKGIEVEL